MTSPWLRRAAIGLVGVAALLAVAAAIVVATFDADRYKQLAIDWMQATHHRTLVIGGPVELSLFPRLAVKVSKVLLSERDRADAFASIDEAVLAVRVLPLLRKEWVMDRVGARGVRATLSRDAAGVRNIDDLIKPESPAGPAAEGGSPMRFDVSAVRFDDLRLHVRDEKAQLEGDVALVSFASGRLADRVESPVSMRATVRLTRPQPVTLSLDGRLTLALDLDKSAVAVTGATLDLEGSGAGVQALSVTLDGALAWDGAAVRAGPLQVTVKSATFGSTSLTRSTLEVKRALFSPTDRRLELDTLQVALAGRQGASPFELSLDWPQLAVDRQQLSGSALSGRIETTGATALKGTFRSAAPTGRFDALRLPGLDLTLTGSAGPRKVDVGVKADMVVDVDRRAAAIDRLDLRGTLVDPGVPPLELTLNGTGSADAKTATWAMHGSINANRFETSGQARLAGAVPDVEASARFDALDLNKLLPPAGQPPTTTATAPADTPVPLDGLKALDGRFTLDAGVLALRQYKVADAKVAATLAHGVLHVTRLAGRAWGGTLEASGSADANSHRLGIRLDASGVNVNALLKDVAAKDLLEGTGHVAADIVSSGVTVGALRSNLAGTASVQLRDGAIKGINLARSFRQAQAALSLKQDAVAQGGAAEKTDFSEMHASARLANGVAQSDDLEVKSPFLRIGGAGRFDIGQGRIDYTARATVTDTSAGQGGAGLDALRGVTVPVALSGPFDAIAWNIQWSDVAAAALKNRLKDSLADTLGARLGVAPSRAGAASAPATSKDALRDTLKGLFK